MSAILLALASAALWGSADFGGGLLSRRFAAYAVVGASQAAGLVAVTLVALGTGAFDSAGAWWTWALLAGASGAVGLVCFYAALASGTMSIVSPIAALGAVVPFGVGVASGESPAAVALVGVALALGGAVAASGPELSGGLAGTSSRSVVLAAVAGVGFGLALTFIAEGAEVDAVMTLWGMRLTSVSAFVVAALALRTTGGLRGGGLAGLVAVAAVGIGDALANLLFAYATQRGFVSITSVLASLYPVVTVVLARLVLGERLLRVQQVGVVAALAGVALLSAG